jgi:hypothetical protein
VISWIEPHEVAKERSKLGRIAFPFIVLISLVLTIICSLSFWGLGMLLEKNLPFYMCLLFSSVLGVMFGWQLLSLNVVQQKVTVNGFDNQIQILGNTTEAHVLSISDLRGYAINRLSNRVTLCLYPKEGGIYSIGLPLQNNNLEAELHKYLSGTIQFSYFDDLAFSKNT